MPVLTDNYTFAFTATGEILNDDSSPSSPFVDVQKVTGLDNVEYRSTEREREGMDGGFVDALYEKMRTIVIEGVIYNATEDYLDTLKANFAPRASVEPFYLLAPTSPERLVYCKSLGIRYAWDQARRLNMVTFQIQLKAEDPTIYEAVVTDTATLGNPESGFGFNLAFNFGFGTSSTAGAASLNNTGNKDADCTFEIVGPVVNPIIVHDESGNRLSFACTLGVGDTLEVNLRNKTVLLGGTTSRRNFLIGTSRWFLLQPGTNTIRFLGTAGAGTPVLNCTFRPAYR